MTIHFKELCQDCRKDWEQESSKLNIKKHNVNDVQRQANEQHISQLITVMETYKDKQMSKDEMQEMILEWMRNDNVLKLKEIGEEQRNALLNVTAQFVSDAQAFDKDMTQEDIAQALRNVWIFLMLGLLFGKPIQYHQAIFAYSMLYPYTDNYLDDEHIGIEDKYVFNLRLQQRLHNIAYDCPNEVEQKMDHLIQKIEEQYPRGLYPDVYESIYRIQEGQEHSLLQQHQEENNILKISIMKGGASVLVDGFLLDGVLDTQQQDFCMHYGFLLQLADDLQDIKEDAKNKHMTMFTLHKDRNKLVKQFINFTQTTMIHPAIQNKTYAYIVENDCLLLVWMAMLQHQDCFSKALLKRIIECLPMSLSFMKKIEEDMKKFSTSNQLKTMVTTLFTSY